ncbi:M1 family metallopeptidase [Aquimarina hainanensis]|uniref:Aminopeptidase N n=1 Tax=Aquimarina hainanensis TaxID=1578017 RepID=A0ABW5NE93_9FLAO
MISHRYKKAFLSIRMMLGCMIVVFISCNSSVQKEIKVTKGVSEELAASRKQQIKEVLYTLSFDIPKEQEKPIHAHLQLEVDISDVAIPLILDFEEKRKMLQSLSVNGKPVTIRHQNGHLIIEASYLVAGKNSIAIDFTAGELSLNRNKDYLYTLLVPDRARTLFPCFDQPNIKAAYQLTINAPKDWKVICGAPLERTEEKGNHIRYEFGTTAKISSYLFSFVVGAFQQEVQNPGIFDMTMLYRETDTVKIKSSIPKIFDLHQQSIDFLQKYTAYPFPYSKMDFATIPGFQYGGMEHVGAIQYRESILFMDSTATLNQQLRRGKLIAHETAHMWFGDLVTMKWFDDVWMKEVFANFMADKIMNPVYPSINHELSFLADHYPAAYSEDRTRGATPIRQKLPNLKDAGTLYGQIIYHKSPIMMRQLETAMGTSAFQEGIQEYIQTYAHDNADWNQLVQILDEKTPLDMKQWSNVWVHQSGRPVYTDQLIYDDKEKIVSYTITQQAEDATDKIWPQQFEIALVYPDSIATLAITSTQKDTRIDQVQGWPKPQAVLYNTDGYGYGVFPIDVTRLQLIHKLPKAVSRGASYINMYEAVLSGTIDAAKAIQFFIKALHQEKEPLLIRILTGNIRSLFWKYLPVSQQAKVVELIEPTVYRLLQSNIGSAIKKPLFGLYSAIAYTPAGKDRLYKIWNKEVVIDQLLLNKDDITNLAMQLAVFEHEKQEIILQKTQEGLKNPDKKKRFTFLLPALSSDVQVRDAFFESFKEVSNREKESWVQTAVRLIHHPLRQEEAVKHLDVSLSLVEEIQQTGDIFFPKSWLNNTIGQYSSEAAYKKLSHFLQSKPEFSPVLKNKLLQATDALYRVQKLHKKSISQ